MEGFCEKKIYNLSPARFRSKAKASFAITAEWFSFVFVYDAHIARVSYSWPLRLKATEQELKCSSCGDSWRRRRDREVTMTSGGDKRYDVRLSKKLSRLLRHRIDANGLRDCLRPDGYVPLKRVLTLPGFARYTASDVASVVSGNEKKRFSLLRQNGATYIRANQGHTIDGLDDDALLERLTLEDATSIGHAVHGTYRSAWSGIVGSGGLKRMARNHIHLATDAPENDKRVISGMRESCELVLWIDIVSAMKLGGLTFYRSANGVILTPGLGEDGLLPLRFVSRCVDRQSGRELFVSTDEDSDNEATKERSKATDSVSMTLTMNERPPKWKLPPYHEIWNYEGDESVIPRKWFHVLCEAFGETFLMEKGVSKETLEERYVRSRQFRKDGFFLITHRSTTVATGFAFVDESDPKLGMVHWVGVAPKSRRQGIARSVVLMILRHLYDRGIRVVQLKTETCREGAIALYRNLGFSVCASKH